MTKEKTLQSTTNLVTEIQIPTNANDGTYDIYKFLPDFSKEATAVEITTNIQNGKNESGTLTTVLNENEGQLSLHLKLNNITGSRTFIHNKRVSCTQQEWNKKQKPHFLPYVYNFTNKNNDNPNYFVTKQEGVDKDYLITQVVSTQLKNQQKDIKFNDLQVGDFLGIVFKDTQDELGVSYFYLGMITNKNKFQLTCLCFDAINLQYTTRGYADPRPEISDGLSHSKMANYNYHDISYFTLVEPTSKELLKFNQEYQLDCLERRTWSITDDSWTKIKVHDIAIIKGTNIDNPNEILYWYGIVREKNKNITDAQIICDHLYTIRELKINNEIDHYSIPFITQTKNITPKLDGVALTAYFSTTSEYYYSWDVENANDFHVGDIYLVLGNISDKSNIECEWQGVIKEINTDKNTIRCQFLSFLTSGESAPIPQIFNSFDSVDVSNSNWKNLCKVGYIFAKVTNNIQDYRVGDICIISGTEAGQSKYHCYAKVIDIIKNKYANSITNETGLVLQVMYNSYIIIQEILEQMPKWDSTQTYPIQKEAFKHVI